MAIVRMDRGTQEEYAEARNMVEVYQERMPDRIVAMIESLRGVCGGFPVDQYEHSLQTATRAERDGASDEIIFLALVHDIGKVISWWGHAEIVAEILRPYMSENVVWLARYHQDFQGRFFHKAVGKDPNEYLKHKGHPCFDQACRLSDWDQLSFDPNYKSLSLEHFKPLINKFCSLNPYKINWKTA